MIVHGIPLPDFSVNPQWAIGLVSQKKYTNS
jgi:hypothetical protein